MMNQSSILEETILEETIKLGYNEDVDRIRLEEYPTLKGTLSSFYQDISSITETA